MINATRLETWDDSLYEFAHPWVREAARAKAQLARQVLQLTSEFWMVREKEPLAMFGVIPYSVLDNSAYVWFLPFQGYSIAHARQSLVLFNGWANDYRKLTAHVDPTNATAVRFAEFFGFKQKEGEVFEWTRSL